MSQAMRQWEESGETEQLRGRPLDLSDDSPEWFANRLLKKEGYSHPLIERARDIDALVAEAEAIKDRIRELESRHACAGKVAETILKGRLLSEYRERPEEANRQIRSYNLGAPQALHRRLIPVRDMATSLDEEALGGG